MAPAAPISDVDLDLRYSETQEQLREGLRAMLTANCPASRVLAGAESDDPFDTRLWQRLVEMGLPGLAVAESDGGAGAGYGEVAIVLEELGRAVAPVPYLGSAVVATEALRRCGDTVLLRELAEGGRRAALLTGFGSRPGAPVTLLADHGGGQLTGEVTSVADALAADVLLVPATTGLYAVLADGPGVLRTPVVSLDETRRLCDIRLSSAPGRLLATGEPAAAAVDAALVAGAALLASEQLGVAQACLDMTVEYLKTRYQFGRPVGGYQALKHRLADLWIEVTQARAVARHAAASLDAAAGSGSAAGGAESVLAASLAQAYCAQVAVRAAQECVQLHGGIGFTWEHPAHLYLKRAKSSAIAFGTAGRHRAALADLVGL